MKKALKKFGILVSIALLALTTVTVTSCKKDEPTPTATITVLSTTNKSGDIKGDGGSATKTWTFNNPNTKAGWDMSIDSRSGSFQLILKDASGKVALDRTLTGGTGAQDAAGTTPDGVAGTWTATIVLTNFTGSGDYSFL